MKLAHWLQPEQLRSIQALQVNLGFDGENNIEENIGQFPRQQGLGTCHLQIRLTP
jgi:hypothetical protein